MTLRERAEAWLESPDTSGELTLIARAGEEVDEDLINIVQQAGVVVERRIGSDSLRLSGAAESDSFEQLESIEQIDYVEVETEGRIQGEDFQSRPATVL